MKTRNLWRSRLRVEELESRWVPAPVLGYSTNWSGYAVTTGNGAVTAVSGSWVVPAVAPTNSGYSSAWVGIDGAGSSTVEQIGTDSDFVGGVARYYAWYEFYPAAPVNLAGVNPGDTISANVSYGSGGFTVSIADNKTGFSFTTTQAVPSAQRSSAEWIQEAPSSFAGVLPLANFGTINFSGAQATVSGATGPADNGWSGTTLNQINMVTSAGALKASTGPLTDSGSAAPSSFSVTFVSSGSGGHHGGKHAPDAPLIPTTVTPQVALSLVSAPVAVARAGTALPTAAPTPTPPAVAPAAAVIVPSVAALFVTPPVTLADSPSDAPAPDSAPATSSGQAAAAPELLPPPTESAASEESAAPAQPDTPAQVPPAQPAPPMETAPTAVGVSENDTTTVESAGLALAVALGGSWGIAMRETGSRRRRLPLRV